MHTSIVGRDRASMRYYCCKTPQEQALTDRPAGAVDVGARWEIVRSGGRGPRATLEEWLRRG